MPTTLGERIKKHRLEVGLTLPDMAIKAGVSKGYLWQIEEGTNKNPSIDVLSKIAKVLDKTIAELTNGEALVKPVNGNSIEIPPSLEEFIRSQKDNNPLSQDDIKMLAGIHYRGKRPASTQDWMTVYSVIKSISKKK